MGVDYTAVFAIGKTFDYAGDAVEFLREHGVLTEAHEDELCTEGDDYISEIAYSEEGFPNVQCLDLYRGDYYYVGYSINARDVDNLVQNVAKAKADWEAKFPNVVADIIHTVRIH
jgi:hypothetical protein